ncbi:hypothetical protein RHGRI_012530 [Rhododendron griersonianum]|uniref:Uncharacterized protein n=1 Tax=Rhododendron griersonianum TaxID=479676 RepID=A0AAV6KRH0_9ERIC|nr:hypothetical protein RHGRI_012530 [Rhododendron griersonianum]
MVSHISRKLQYLEVFQKLTLSFQFPVHLASRVEHINITSPIELTPFLEASSRLELSKLASVVDKYKRPMPKLRNTTVGKADDHSGPMDVHQIAEKFRVDIAQIQKILESVSLPPEELQILHDFGLCAKV